MATPASAKYVALAGTVALLTAVFLLVARVLGLGFFADFLSRTVLVGFLTGVGFRVGIAVLAKCWASKFIPSERSNNWFRFPRLAACTPGNRTLSAVV